MGSLLRLAISFIALARLRDGLSLGPPIRRERFTHVYLFAELALCIAPHKAFVATVGWINSRLPAIGRSFGCGYAL
jgi:hypothetical protein